MNSSSRRPLFISFLLSIAVLVGIGLLFADSFRSHEPLKPLDPIEASIYERPKAEPHLVSSRPVVHEKMPVVKTETKISTRPSESSAGHVAQPVAEEKNVVDSTGAKEPATHGPTLLHSVNPKIPSYLKNENLNASVLLEFSISASGAVVAHLLKTSGNEELDAIALKTAREWTFSPARDAGSAVDSKVRLRINFAVD